MNNFEAKLQINFDVSLPAEFDREKFSRPPDDFIISRHRDNSVASQFGDAQWDISTWQVDGRSTLLNFALWDEQAISSSQRDISRGARWLMFALIWLREGSPFSTGTLMNYMFVIRALCFFADNHSLNIEGLMKNDEALIIFAERNCTDGKRKSLWALMSNLIRIGENLLGFSTIGLYTLRRMRERARRLIIEAKQTPPIPTRIYCQILISLSEELSEWEKRADECISLLQRCGNNPVYGRRPRSQQRLASVQTTGMEPKTNWLDVASLNLRDYLRANGQCDNITGLASMATQIQLVCKLIIQAYTGMRDDEALTLPLDCAETSELDKKITRLVVGRTTKLTGRARTVRWVTNKETHRAISTATRIANVIYDTWRASPIADIKSAISVKPLFVSIAYLSLGGKRRVLPPDGHFFTGFLSFARFSRLRERLQPLIANEDLEELEQVDEHRAWRTEQYFQPGSPWHLETHQLRRSLAIYAQRSGLVTLPSLRRQLQHLTDEMARYYARGSEYSRDIFGVNRPDDGHFCFDWQSTQIESEWISYANQVLYTDEKLFGGHAAFVKNRVMRDDGVITQKLRQETLQLFKRGQLHFRETIMGGCTKGEVCDSPALDWLNLSCIATNCSNLVGNVQKLDAIIKEQKILLKTISPSSLLFRTESANLKILESARLKVA